MNLTCLLNAPGVVMACACLWLEPLPGRAADRQTPADPPPGTIDLTREQLLDHIQGGWTGITRAALSTRGAQKQTPAMRRVNLFLWFF